MTEAELQKACIELLNRSQLCHWRIPLGEKRPRGSMGSSSVVGFPDLCGITKSGRFWAVELKTDKGKLRSSQEIWIRKLLDSGAVVRVIRSVGEMAAFIQNVQTNF
jgi:hypothetical protein